MTKQFASVQEGLKSVACVHQSLQGDHTTLPRKYQCHHQSIEASTEGLSSKEKRFSLHGRQPLKKQHVFTLSLVA